MRVLQLGLLLLLCLPRLSAQEREPFYAFFPAASGADWKELRHNLLGFSVEMPASWTFGVTGSGELTVALIYPDGMNTAVFSSAYATVEIGSVRLGDGSLDSASAALLTGLRTRHSSLRIVEPVSAVVRGGRQARTLLLTWESRSGQTIVEQIDLIADGPRAVSVAIRAASAAFEANRALYRRIARSVRPLARRA